MNSMKAKMLEICALIVLLAMPCILIREQGDGQNRHVETSMQRTEIKAQSSGNKQKYTEETEKNRLLNITVEDKSENGMVRIQDNASVMDEDEINKYIFDTHVFSNMAKKTSLKFLFLKSLKVYFPNLDNMVWKITGKDENNYIVEFYGNTNGSYDECAYTGKYILQPNFTITVLEDSIELRPENGFCTYATGEIYAYQGCYIEECTGSYFDSSRNNRFDVSFPIFYTIDNEWENFNSNIWMGLENWFVNTTKDDQDVSIMLDYEIKTCSDNLFSILFYGKWEKDGCKEDIAMALTVSVLSEKLFSRSMFIRDEKDDAFYDYYVEDGKLYFISSEKAGWKNVEIGKVEMVYCRVDRIERHIYNSNGCWLGNCYYEVPVIGTISEEAKKISQCIREDLGRFLNETATVFEEVVNLSPIANAEYASEGDVATYLNGTGGLHCYVDTEITHNNNGILEITYYYNILETTGEAVAVYDLNAGTVVEHQDWQSNVIQKLHQPGT